MKTKKLVVQATALAPIGADPIRDFLKTMPRKTVILGCTGSRSGNKKSINICYLENGKIHYAHCCYNEVTSGSVSANIETFSTNWKGVAV